MSHSYKLRLNDEAYIDLRATNQGVQQFFDAAHKGECAFVYDSANIRQFIAAHILYRYCRLRSGFTALEATRADDLQRWVHEHPTGTVALLNPTYSVEFMHALAQRCHQMLVYVSHYSLYRKFIQARVGMPARFFIVSDLQAYLEELVYTSCYPFGNEFPFYVQSFVNESIVPTISPSEQQLLLSLPRDHEVWLRNYPDEFDIATDAEQLGYRVIDHGGRLSRMIFSSAYGTMVNGRRVINVNASFEDFSGTLHLLNKNFARRQTDAIDYWCVYDIHRDNVRYRLQRKNDEVDLVDELAHLDPVGSPSLVNITRIVDPTHFTRLTLPAKRKWFWQK